MKGIVFNLLEEAIVEHKGAPSWERLLDLACVDGAYTSLGNYPDEELEHLVWSASVMLSTTTGEVLRWFGQHAIPILTARYPQFFAPHRTARSFVASINSIIHPEVHKLYPGARCPAFGFVDEPDGTLRIKYHSPRRLCMLAHGFIEGAAAHYRQAVDVTHASCMNHGARGCELHVRFS